MGSASAMWCPYSSGAITLRKINTEPVVEAIRRVVRRDQRAYKRSRKEDFMGTNYGLCCVLETTTGEYQ